MKRSWRVRSSSSAVLDCEIVCLQPDGKTDFNALLFRREWPYFYAFESPRAGGRGPAGPATPRAKAPARADHSPLCLARIPSTTSGKPHPYSQLTLAGVDARASTGSVRPGNFPGARRMPPAGQRLPALYPWREAAVLDRPAKRGPLELCGGRLTVRVSAEGWPAVAGPTCANA
jgi:hypothetical protein